MAIGLPEALAEGDQLGKEHGFAARDDDVRNC
jgi:hypothetical protein